MTVDIFHGFGSSVTENWRTKRAVPEPNLKEFKGEVSVYVPPTIVALQRFFNDRSSKVEMDTLLA